MPHRYSTVAHWDLAAIRPLSPDLNGHPTLRWWSHVQLTSGHRRPTGTIGDRLVGCRRLPDPRLEHHPRVRLEPASKSSPTSSLRPCGGSPRITRIATSWARMVDGTHAGWSPGAAGWPVAP